MTRARGCPCPPRGSAIHSFACLSPSRGACGRPGRCSSPRGGGPRARPRSSCGAPRDGALVGLDRAAPWPCRARARRRPSRRRRRSPRRCAGRARRARWRPSASSARSWETRTTPPARSPSSAREAREPVGVEVVGRLVEEDDVEARRAQGREAGARRLAAGQRAQRAVEQVGAEAELGGGRGEAGLGVVAAEREPALERGRVRLDARRGRRPRASRRARRRAGSAAATPMRSRIVARTVAPRGGRRRSRAAAGSRPCRARAPCRRRAPRGRRGCAAAWTCPSRSGRSSAMRLPGVDAEVDGVEEGSGAVVAGDAAGVEEGRRHAGSFRGEGRREDSREPAAWAGRSVAAVSERHACDGPEGRRPRYRPIERPSSAANPTRHLHSSLHARRRRQ